MKQAITFEEFLSLLGNMGRYQKFVLAMTIYCCLISGFITFCGMVNLMVPDHRCAIPGLDNDTYAIQNEAHRRLVNASIPEDEDFASCYLIKPERQRLLSRSNSSGASGDLLVPESSDDYMTCDRWVFDRSVFTLTVTEKLDLVCGNTIYRTTGNLVMMLGKTLGSFCSSLTDVYGRKRVLVLTFPVVVSMLLVNTFVMVNIPLFYFFRFLLFTTSQPFFYTCLTIGLEITGKANRNLINVVMFLVWSVGCLTLAAVASVVTSYVHLNLLVTLFTSVLVSYFWILPESPRWLLANGRVKEARKILEKLARVNKKLFPEEDFQNLLITEFKINAKEAEIANVSDGDENGTLMTKEKSKMENGGAETKVVEPSKGSENGAAPVTFTKGFFLLLRNKQILRRCLIVACIWTIVSAMFYATMFNASNLSGNVFLNYILLYAVDLVAAIPLFLLVDRFGRKRSFIFNMAVAVGGLASCLLPYFLMEPGTSRDWVFNGLSLVGRAGVSNTFMIIILHTAELFPTNLRMTSICISNTTAKVGSTLSPYVADLGLLIGGAISGILPLIVCGAAGLVGILLMTTLDETAQKNLPDNLEAALTKDKDTSDSCLTGDQELQDLTKN